MIEDKWGKSALEIFKDRMRIGDVVIIANGNRKFRAVGRITGEYRYDKNSEVRYCHFRSVEWLYAGQDIEVSEIYDRNFLSRPFMVLPNQERRPGKLQRD